MAICFPLEIQFLHAMSCWIWCLNNWNLPFLCCVFLDKFWNMLEPWNNRASFLQEVVFYEDGEPKIDGEPGDLKVRFFPCRKKWTCFIMMYVLTVTYIGSFQYLGTVPHPHSSSWPIHKRSKRPSHHRYYNSGNLDILLLTIVSCS